MGYSSNWSGNQTLNLATGVRVPHTLPTIYMKQKTGYMCKIAFDYEVEGAIKGTCIYPSINALIAAHKALQEPNDGLCKIIKVTLTISD